MKKTFLTMLLLVVMPASLSARVFTSEDGGKTLNADFVRYKVSTGMVTLRDGVRNMVMPANKFSENDRKFFEESQREIDKKEGLKVNIESNTNYSKEPRGSIQVSYRTSSYVFEVSNTSESYLDGLKLRYWVVVEQGEKGNEKIEIKSETHQLTSLSPGATASVKGPELKLTSGAKVGSAAGCATCPKVRNAAAEKAGKVSRERVLGTKVEIVDSKGEVVYSDISSNRMASLLAEKNSN
jgi:hypothetical protein